MTHRVQTTCTEKKINSRDTQRIYAPSFERLQERLESLTPATDQDIDFLLRNPLDLSRGEGGKQLESQINSANRH